MDIKYYTLKEAAELLGMTKPGIRYHLKALSETIEKDEKGQIIVPESILQRIRNNMKPESEVESKPESSTRKPESKPESRKLLSGNEPESDAELSEIPESKPESRPESVRKVESTDEVVTFTLTALRQQIEAKDEQLAEKDRQIAQLVEQLGTVTEALVTAQRTIESSQRALEASQALHAATVKQLQTAQTVVSSPIQEEGPQNTDQEEPKEKPEDRRWFIPDDDEVDPPLQKRKKRSLLDWLLGRD